MPIVILRHRDAAKGCSRRGDVRSPGEGAFADLVLFDADRIADQATYDNPRQTCTGIERVMVNGQWAFAQGQALPHLTSV